ncbi:MAG: hypothetical protein DHS20C01_25170 [marine bacterium B5-7]|nr:MAG: hypothetical protein DHS20C01_25170 [marine bacterium B5-7]
MSKLCLVTALSCEARPWIEHYGLKPIASFGFKAYTSDDIALVVSGIGQNACAAATGFLAGHFQTGPECVWINAGIAGHPDLPRGTVVVVNKSRYVNQSEFHYPSIPIPLKLFSAECLTVDTVESEYADQMLYDMECAGYFGAARRFSPVDLVHAVKVVSDNRVHSWSDLDRHAISDLINSRLETIIQTFINPLLDLATIIRDDNAEIDVHEFTDRWHFTVTNTHRLRALLFDIAAVNAGKIPFPDEFNKCHSAREVINQLNTRLDSLKPTWSE